MIDFPFLYRATLFTYTVQSEQANIQRMQKLFEDKGLYPSMFQEIVNGTAVMRFELVNPKGEWRIKFQEQRIDIVLGIDFKDLKKQTSEENFIDLAKECFQRLVTNLDYKAFRLAFSAIYVLKDTLDIKTIYQKMMKPCSLFAATQPKEWNFRNIFRVEKEINTKMNTLNYCFDANIALVESSQPGLFKSERIIFTTDINTLQGDTIDYKYNNKDIQDFFKNVSDWNSELKNSYCELLEK